MSRLLSLLLLLAACVGHVLGDEVVFADALADPSLPGWRTNWKPATPVALAVVAGPEGRPAVRFASARAVNAMAVHDLPAARLAGKSVLFSIWRKADGIVTGEMHYHNAKTMLMWRGKTDERVMNPGTVRSDLKGTTDWEFHRYLVRFPDDLQFARIHLGLENCAGAASFADLKIMVTDRFPDEAAFESYLAEEEERALVEAAKGQTRVEAVPGAIPRVFAGSRFVPWELWSKAVRQQVLDSVPEAKPTGDGSFRDSLMAAFLARADELQAGVDGPIGAQRCAAAAGFRARAAYLAAGGPGAVAQRLGVAGEPVAVSPLLFGNNINAEHLAAVYDPAKGAFAPEFLERVRPMGIRFLRYPGGCNADVFNWRESVGPVAQRGHFINYHGADDRGPMVPGVDDVLRWCEQDGMVPILTTAFLYDKPDRIDLANSTRKSIPPYVAEYLKTAEDRVTLAADWVEYCNGSADTPMGRLRAQNGHPEPYGVKYWEVGNESWGADPVGSTTAELYAAAFPAYVEAMKARDPSIHVLLNGHGHKPEWNDTLLRLAGKHADGMQIHIYQAPAAYRVLSPDARSATALDVRRRRLRRGLQQDPSPLGDLAKQVDGIPARLAELDGAMQRHLGKRIPVFVTEFGMGNARDQEIMVSQTSAVLVADMLRVFLSTPLVQGTNKWALYGGYWFSQVNGPSRRNPDLPYYIRPERGTHEILAFCRGEARLPTTNAPGEPVSSVAFADGGQVRVLLVNRSATDWAAVTLAAPAAGGPAEAVFLDAGHPLFGNETDHGLVKLGRFVFPYDPAEPLLLPPMSVFGVAMKAMVK